MPDWGPKLKGLTPGSVFPQVVVDWSRFLHTRAYSQSFTSWNGREDSSVFIVSDFFSQRRKCRRSLPGSSKKDLSEHPGWQLRPECCRVRSPAQTIGTSGGATQCWQPSTERGLQLLTSARSSRSAQMKDSDKCRELSIPSAPKRWPYKCKHLQPSEVKCPHNYNPNLISSELIWSSLKHCSANWV